MSRVVGADVWKNGWIAVVTVDGWIASIDAYETMADLATAEPDAEVIAVDIPIGLPIAPPRPADSAARHFIGARSSSVFPTPPRDVLEADTYQDALRLSRKRYGVGLTAQSYSLRRRILETDKVARSDARLIEIHPEVTFRALAGRPRRSRRRAGTDTPSGDASCRVLGCRSLIVSPTPWVRSRPTMCSTPLQERGRPLVLRRAKHEPFPRRPPFPASVR